MEPAADMEDWRIDWHADILVCCVWYICLFFRIAAKKKKTGGGLVNVLDIHYSITHLSTKAL
jgi:hypothetical protein